ncbi:MAG: hypothetical protein HYZ49_08030 [Chloroflexi bacterium]|nr:hypothetical protein [Chloroflexota bacterium]
MNHAPPVAARPAPAQLRPASLDSTSLATPQAAATLLSPTSRFAPTVRRLVILIPDADTDESLLARQIWSMASRRELSVLLLGLSRNAGSGPRARRRLATLAALARDKTVHVEIKLEIGADWLQALRSIHRYSDLIVCHAEQHLAQWGMRRKPLSHWIARELNESVCVLTDFYPHLPPDHVNPASRLIAGAVPFLILFGFTALQILIHQMTRGTASIILMSASVLIEYSLIGAWHFLIN